MGYMAGISSTKIKGICEKYGIKDENLIKAITEIIAENNKMLVKDIPQESYEAMKRSARAKGINL